MFSMVFYVEDDPLYQVMIEQLKNTDQLNDIIQNHMHDTGNYHQTSNVQDVAVDPGFTLSMSSRAFRLKQR